MYHIYIICSNFGSRSLASKCSASIALSIVNRSVTMSGLNTTWKIPHEHAKHVEDTTFVRVPGSHNTSLLKLVCENNPLAEGMNLSSLASSSQASSLQLQPLKSGLRWAWHGGGSMGPDGQPQPQLVRWSMGPDGLGRDEPMYEDNDTLEMPSTKKSSTQKTPTKKSPAKKSSAKKSPAKTSSTKKSSAKKSSTQKNKRL